MRRKILQPLYTGYVLVTFAVSILAAFPFFVIVGMGNSPAARRAIYSLIKYWCKGWLWITGMRVTLLGPRPAEGRYVVVVNHISYLDTLVIFPAIPGYFRPLGKKEISKIPIVGFIYKQIVIMVDRSNVHSRARSLRLLWRVLHREGNIIIFPEGTFNETNDVLKSFYDGAFRLAINTQKSILPIIFPDTVHRWHYSAWWKLWPGMNRAVYLPPVDVAGLTLADLPQLKEKVFDLMKTELKKYDYPAANSAKQGESANA
jgi:1-acyl-sn-glycerol-3-phosphate acyltransferase